ncbi:tyrosine-type recombinase/integrase [Rhodococcus hoagii]|nr:tyrosine-type recombinase/integrase [Prescottella equi]
MDVGTISNTFLRLREHLGLDEHVTFKSLRHFYASTLIASGASVTMVAEYLGHASPAITLEFMPICGPATTTEHGKRLMRLRCYLMMVRDRAGPGR